MSATALLLALVLAAPSPDPAAGNGCVLCHPEQKVAHELSVHRREGIGCTSCHGGDASAVEVAPAHRAPFRGRPRRLEIPSLCATCHADAVRMRAYNLPSDQYALYQTSAHGQLLARGDERAAVCTDCHGVHDVRAPEDPLSHVHQRNVPKTCAGCHGDPEFLKRYGKTDNPYEDYIGSVHGKALLEQGNSGAPECARCHGAHGAAPPGVGDVDKVCGQCHASTRSYYLESPHRAAMQEARLPECASCHGNHRIQRTDVATLDAVCRKCHENDSPEVERGVAMRTVFAQAHDEIDKARTVVERAAEVPLYVEDYESRLEEARTSLLESLTLIHTADLKRVEETTRRARAKASEVESEIRGKLDNLRWRRVGLILFWFYLLLTVAILLRSRRRVTGAQS